MKRTEPFSEKAQRNAFLAFALGVATLGAALYTFNWQKGCNPNHPYHYVFQKQCTAANQLPQ